MHIPDASLARDVARVLDRNGVAFVLIGAAALAVRGLSRGTHDIDFMTTDSSVLDVDWIAELGRDAHVDVRRGDFDDPLAGVVRLAREGSADVDLVVAKWNWQQTIVARSEPVDLELFRVRVPDVADLVILKVDAGSFLDQRDAAQLLEIYGPEALVAVDARAGELPESVRRAWLRLRANVENV